MTSDAPTRPDATSPRADGSDAQRRLEELLACSDVVSDIVRGFLNLRADEVDEGIATALRRLGEHLGTDRVYTFECRGPRLTLDGTMDNTFEWCAPGVAPEIDNLQDVPVAVMEHWFHLLTTGEPVMVDDVASLPEDQRDVHDHLASQGIRSILVVPMMSIGDLVGIMGFDSVNSRRTFDSFETGLLRSVADVVTSVLVRRRADASTQRAERRLVALTRYATDVILVVDERARITYASESWARLGFDVADMIGTRWTRYVHPDDLASIRRIIEPQVRSRVAERVTRLPDLRVTTAHGGWCWLAGSVSDARHDEAVAGFVVNAHDVTERRHAEDRMAHEAMHDPLTGLGNRAMLAERLEDVRRRSGSEVTGVALVFLDLDRFKLVNDGHGHTIGDDILVQVGRRLSAVIRATDSIARFGGDEFVVLVDRFDDRCEVDAVVQRLRAALTDPVVVGDTEYRVTASIGVVMVDGSTLDPAAVLRDADTAMYRAKERGRDRVVVFDDALREQALRRVALNDRLPRALDADLLHVVYQPVVDTVDGRVVGAEALARWTDSELGVVSPVEFIPVAEELGLIVPLGEMVLDRAVGEAVSWPDDLEIAVNLSLSQLTQPGLVDLVVSTLGRHGCDPQRLCLEVTESSLINHPAHVIETLHRLRSLGVRTALDDFGTGYSSLSLLRELPIDRLKIDKAFVRGVHCDERDRRLVDAVIGLASDFGMGILAEGVELEAQRQALVEAGCPLAQGYLFARPMPAEAFAAAVRRPTGVPSA